MYVCKGACVCPQELEDEVQAGCQALAIPLPIPVSVLLGSLGHLPATAEGAAAGTGSGNVFVQLLLAAIHPESHIPDTPVRKVGGRVL